MNMKAKIIEIGDLLIIVHYLELYIGTCFCIIQGYRSKTNDVVVTGMLNMYYALQERLSLLRNVGGGLYCAIIN